MIISGLAAVFWDRHSGDPGAEYSPRFGVYERIHPGAFEQSFGERDITCCVSHAADAELARISNGTLRLHESLRGLFFEAHCPDATATRYAFTPGEMRGASWRGIIRESKCRDELRDGRMVTVVDIFRIELIECGPTDHQHTGAYRACYAIARRDDADSFSPVTSRFLQVSKIERLHQAKDIF